MARTTLARLDEYKARTGIYAPRKPRHVRMAESLERRREAAQKAAELRHSGTISACPMKRAAAFNDALLLWAYGEISVNDALGLAAKYHRVSVNWLRENWVSFGWTSGRPSHARNRAEARYVIESVYG